jgi:hypothetical protein
MTSAHGDLGAPDSSPDVLVAGRPRTEGLRVIGEGLSVFALGFGGLWLSFRLAGDAKTILGAGPLFGGAMVGHGVIQSVFGERVRWLRIVAAIVGGIVGIGVAIVLLEELLGIVF